MHADKVISVHNSVDEPVEGNGEVDITVVVDVDIEPVKEENRPMVVVVKEGELTPFLPKNNEDGIPEVPHFGDVEEPEKTGNRGVFDVVADARGEAVTISIGQKASFNRHVRTEHDLGNVVDKLERIRVDSGYAGLHNDRTDEDEDGIG